MEMTRRETRSGCGDPAAVTVSLDTSTVMLQLCRIVTLFSAIMFAPPTTELQPEL